MQDILQKWTQRILKRMVSRCKKKSILFFAVSDADAAALRRVQAEFVLLAEDEAETHKEFDRVIAMEELSAQNGFGAVYIGEGLFALPEDERMPIYATLLEAAEFVVLCTPAEAAQKPPEVLAQFEGLRVCETEKGAGAYAGVNPKKHQPEEAEAANMPTYAVYGIYKNEEKFIERFLASVRDADEIVLCDTGTTDKTNEIIADFKQRNPDVNLKTYTISVQPWRFDDAYNAALLLVSGDIDMCINMGMDEWLMNGWRAVLDAAWDIRYTRFYHRFQTDWGNGNIARHNHDRPHTRHGYIWRLPVHEILEYSGEERVKWAYDFWIYHAPDTGKARSSYMPLLEMSAKERPDVWKTWGFLASEYLTARRYDDALAAVDKAMALPPSDKGHLHKLKYFIYRAQGKTDLALLHVDSAIAQLPYRREPIVEKARYLSSLNRATEAYLTLRQAAKQTREIIDYHHNAGCWGVHFDTLMAQMKEAAQKEEETP